MVDGPPPERDLPVASLTPRRGLLDDLDWPVRAGEPPGIIARRRTHPVVMAREALPEHPR